MFLQPVTHRGSFSVPVQITLQRGRRCQRREDISFNSFNNGRKESGEGKGGDKSKTQAQVCTAGEDRAILLGFVMMGFSILMYFVLGVTLIKPYMLSVWSETSNCTLMWSEILDDWVDCSFMCGVDCRGHAKYPCLQVFVNLSYTGKKTVLHYNDEAIQVNPKCFYIPKCLRDRTELLAEAEKIKNSLLLANGTPFNCFYIPGKKPEDAIMYKKYTLSVMVHCLFWPTLMLAGGALIVALVKLNQHLSRVCTSYSLAYENTQALAPASEESQERRPGKLDQLLRWRPNQQMQHTSLSEGK
ncbi:calcium-activated potassium channel subunit beta-3-like [Acipenser oxyrinchus oxyrinchus]|uniref:Calcium-activated potassium channel subunit beta-3-like n=1 Tax=Acipenser oxyrinchus oxyrinchus TaxID=40147 RepID=A0AAD8DH73_ACIOX|nr:calcium-activated potassium channel subunit beta-3-like [Acipenser oxyrinchus oxyrinchus]